MEAVTLTDVGYRYPRRERAALRGVDLRIEAGELVLLLGDSGSGKSTLLRAMLGLVPHFHGGELSGRVVTDGLDTRDHRPGEIARHAGLVFQDPEAQMVMRTALREAGFGLENMGWPAADIAARAQEALMVTGASALAERPAEQLSGGEQQRLAIASVVSMGQRVLLLDEPTSQLDPVAAEELLGLVVRVNRDRGTTVVLAEHRTGRIFDEADRVIVMDAGRIVIDAAPADAAARLASVAPWLLPPVAQAFVRAGRPELPLTVRAARAAAGRLPASEPAAPGPRAKHPVATVTGAHKRLAAIDALRGAGTTFAAGETTVLMGENGAGKTTLALAACGLIDVDRGKIERTGRAGYVSQNPAHYLLHETVEEEVAYALRNLGVDGGERRRRVTAELARFDLADRAGGHPRDLSSGERQRLAIASVTVMRPELLILDEPTRGVDGLRKLAVIELVRELQFERHRHGRGHPRHGLRGRGRRRGHNHGGRAGAARPRAARAAGRAAVLCLPGGAGVRLRVGGGGGRAVGTTEPGEPSMPSLVAAIGLVLVIAALATVESGTQPLPRADADRRAGRGGRGRAGAVRVRAQRPAADDGGGGHRRLPRPARGLATGATAAVASNVFLGQGPWTPWQMLAWGLVGATAGMIGDPLRSRWLLAAFGIFWGFGFDWIIDVWSWAALGPSADASSFVAYVWPASGSTSPTPPATR